MATTITSAGVPISVTLTAYESRRETRSIVHTILSNPVPDVTLRPSGLRRGTLTLTFLGPNAETDSATAEATLAAGSVCALASTDRSSINMSFIRPESGGLVRAIGQTLVTWTLSFDWQEVPA